MAQCHGLIIVRNWLSRHFTWDSSDFACGTYDETIPPPVCRHFKALSSYLGDPSSFFPSLVLSARSCGISWLYFLEITCASKSLSSDFFLVVSVWVSVSSSSSYSTQTAAARDVKETFSVYYWSFFPWRTYQTMSVWNSKWKSSSWTDCRLNHYCVIAICDGE